MSRPARVAYPGSFAPPTVAHLEIARAASIHVGDAVVEWIVSRVALGKDPALGPSLDARIALLESIAVDHDFLAVRVSDHQLIADVAAGYDAVVVGADKWRQIIDPAWYDSAAACAAARSRLPRVLVVPRAGDHLDDDHDGRHAGIELLPVDPSLHEVSSTAARDGAHHLMLPAAQAFAARTGHWR